MLNRIAARRRTALVGTRLHKLAYSLSGGRLLGRWVGAPVLIMETVGRRSGKLRATPVIYEPVDDGFAVVAANAGVDADPQWWLNLKAAGEGTVRVGRRHLQVRPRLVEGPERERIWAAFAERAPTIRHYPSYTDRSFPIVVLEPLN